MSLLNKILNTSIDNLQRSKAPPPNKEVLKLYRELLKFANLFDWTNTKG